MSTSPHSPVDSPASSFSKTVDNSLYHLPAKFEYNEDNDELFQALKYLRGKIKDLHGSSPEKGQSEVGTGTDVGTDFNLQSVVNLNRSTNIVDAGPIIEKSMSENVAVSKDSINPEQGSEDLESIKQSYQQSLRNSRSLIPALNDSNSPMVTPRNINPEITEKIKDRISTILRPPLEGQGDGFEEYNLNRSQNQKQTLFLDSSEVSENPKENFEDPEGQISSKKNKKSSFSEELEALGIDLSRDQNSSRSSAKDQFNVSLALAQALAEDKNTSPLQTLTSNTVVKTEAQPDLDADLSTKFPSLKLESLTEPHPDLRAETNQNEVYAEIARNYSPPASQNSLTGNINEQLISADERCSNLEQQLANLKSIVKQTTSSHSIEIEKILEESRKHADLERSMRDYMMSEDYRGSHHGGQRGDEGFDFNSRALDLSDPTFMQEVINRLRAKNMDRKKLKKVSEKLAAHTTINQVGLDLLKQLRLSSESSRKNSEATTTNTNEISDALRGSQLKKVRSLQGFDRPKTAHGQRSRHIRSYKSDSNFAKKPVSKAVNGRARSKSDKQRPQTSSGNANSKSTLQKRASSKPSNKEKEEKSAQPHFTADTFQSRQRKIENHKITKQLLQSLKNKPKVRTSDNVLNPKIPRSGNHVHRELESQDPVPFIVGKSSSKSFNMNANIQQLKGSALKKVVTPQAFVNHYQYDDINNYLPKKLTSQRDYLKCIMEAQQKILD